MSVRAPRERAAVRHQVFEASPRAPDTRPFARIKPKLYANEKRVLGETEQPVTLQSLVLASPRGFEPRLPR